MRIHLFTVFFQILLVLGGTSLLLTGCENSSSAPQVKRAVPVTIAHVERKDIQNTLSAIGVVHPFVSVDVKPQVGGQIIATKVKAGQEVEKGQVLFLIDPRTYQSAVDQAKAQVASSKAQRKRAEGDKARYAKIIRSNSISEEQYAHSIVEVQLQTAAVAQAEAALSFAELQLEYATIVAPVAGRIGSILVDEGNVVAANDGRVLLTINTMHPVKVFFSVPERYLGAIREKEAHSGVVVAVSPDGDNHPPAKGTLTSVDNQVDSTTGTIKFEGTLENADNRLWPGQFARIAIELDATKDALIVPASSVLEGSAGTYVYVVKADNTVEARVISAVPVSAYETSVVSGLMEGEAVVTDGLLNLAPGFLVEEKGLPDLVEKSQKQNDEKGQISQTKAQSATPLNAQVKAQSNAPSNSPVDRQVTGQSDVQAQSHVGIQSNSRSTSESTSQINSNNNSTVAQKIKETAAAGAN